MRVAKCFLACTQNFKYYLFSYLMEIYTKTHAYTHVRAHTHTHAHTQIYVYTESKSSLSR